MSEEGFAARVALCSWKVPGLAAFRPFAVVTMEPPNGNELRGLAPLPSAEVDVLESRPPHFVPVPDEIDDAGAILAPPTAAALGLWSALGLELGDVAVHTFGAGCRLVSQVARWGGGLPVIEVRREGAARGTESVSMESPEEAVSRLREQARLSPGFAAVDLSGRPEVVDLLLGVLPPWGRLMLAGTYEEPLTVDFYGNVHRKGVLLRSTRYDPLATIEGSTGGSPLLRRAFRLLAHPRRAEVVEHLLATPE